MRISVISDGRDAKNFESSSMGIIIVYNAYRKENAKVPLNIKKLSIKTDLGGAGMFFPVISLNSFS